MKRMLDQKAIDFLNSLGDSLKYESSTNTFEVGTNLYVDGDLTIGGTYITGQGGRINIEENYHFYFESKNGETSAQLELPSNVDFLNILTDQNTKTFFGNQSILGIGNIDLYKHYLNITAKSPGNTSSSCYICIYSSSNINCTSSTGATQKLKDLLKISGTAERYYDSGMTGGGESACILYWSGQVLQVSVDTENYTITAIEDTVETI